MGDSHLLVSEERRSLLIGGEGKLERLLRNFKRGAGSRGTKTEVSFSRNATRRGRLEG